MVENRGAPHDLKPRGIRIRDQKTLWGSCGRAQILRLDRKLIRLQKPVLEYVVVPERCHLRHHAHSPEFWNLVKRVLPDYEERQEWLEANKISLQ